MKEGSFSRMRRGVSRAREERQWEEIPGGRKADFLEMKVMWVSIATPSHLLLQSPNQDGELDSSSNWQLDPTELASKFTSRTKALILNTPNNPLGKVPERPPPGTPPDWLTSLLCYSCAAMGPQFLCL